MKDKKFYFYWGGVYTETNEIQHNMYSDKNEGIPFLIFVSD